MNPLLFAVVPAEEAVPASVKADTAVPTPTLMEGT